VKTRWGQPLTKKGYRKFKVIWGLYTIVWFCIIFWVWYSWDVSQWYKVGVSIILVLGTPSLHDLTMSYEQYRNEWEEQHPDTKVD